MTKGVIMDSKSSGAYMFKKEDDLVLMIYAELSRKELLGRGMAIGSFAGTRQAYITRQRGQRSSYEV